MSAPLPMVANAHADRCVQLILASENGAQQADLTSGVAFYTAAHRSMEGLSKVEGRGHLTMGTVNAVGLAASRIEVPPA